MLLWDNQRVATISWEYIEESVSEIVFINFVGRNRAFNYFAENAIRHGVTVERQFFDAQSSGSEIRDPTCKKGNQEEPCSLEATSWIEASSQGL